MNRQIYYANNMSERSWVRPNFLEPIAENKTSESQIETSKKVLQLVTDTGLDITQVNGQRKLGPPPGWIGPPPDPTCEVFVGKIPRNIYENVIYPIFKTAGEIYEIRLMMDFSGTNRGYCFVMYTKLEYAKRAIAELNNYEIRPGKRIGVVASFNNCRLCIKQLPNDLDVKKFIKKICGMTSDVGKVSVYRYQDGRIKNALISYNTHIGAAMARRRLVPERASIVGGCELGVDWACPNVTLYNVTEESGIIDENGHVETKTITINPIKIPKKNSNQSESSNENGTSDLDRNKYIQQKISDSGQNSKNLLNKNFLGRRKVKKLNKSSISSKQRSSSESDLSKGIIGIPLNSVSMKPLSSKLKNFGNDFKQKKIESSNMRNYSSNLDLSKKFTDSKNLSDIFNNPNYGFFDLKNKENDSIKYQHMYSSNPVIPSPSQHFFVNNNRIGSGSLMNLNSQCSPGENFYNNKSISVENFLPYFNKNLTLNTQPNYAGNGFLNTLSAFNRFDNNNFLINSDNYSSTNLTNNQNKYVQLNIPNLNQQNIGYVNNKKISGFEAQKIPFDFYNQNQIPNYHSEITSNNNDNYSNVSLIPENGYQYANNRNENNQNFLNNFNCSTIDCNCYNNNYNYNQELNINNVPNIPQFDTRAFGLGKVNPDFIYSRYPRPILNRSLSENSLF